LSSKFAKNNFIGLSSRSVFHLMEDFLIIKKCGS